MTKVFHEIFNFIRLSASLKLRSLWVECTPEARALLDIRAELNEMAYYTRWFVASMLLLLQSVCVYGIVEAVGLQYFVSRGQRMYYSHENMINVPILLKLVGIFA